MRAAADRTSKSRTMQTCLLWRESAVECVWILRKWGMTGCSLFALVWVHVAVSCRLCKGSAGSVEQRDDLLDRLFAAAVSSSSACVHSWQPSQLSSVVDRFREKETRNWKAKYPLAKSTSFEKRKRSKMPVVQHPSVENRNMTNDERWWWLPFLYTWFSASFPPQCPAPFLVHTFGAETVRRMGEKRDRKG